MFWYYVKTSWHRYRKLPLYGKVRVCRNTRCSSREFQILNIALCTYLNSTDADVVPRAVLCRAWRIPHMGWRGQTRADHVRLCAEDQPFALRVDDPCSHARYAPNIWKFPCCTPSDMRPPTVLISFPPCIGHTTIVTLCGFAYGMSGWFIAAPASLVGSATAFVVLRFLFSRRLQKWSSTNEKWQALEAVVVCHPLSRPQSR